MIDSFELLRVLSNGTFHSGQSLGNHFGVSRTAICQTVHKLAEYGIEIDAVSGRGYRLKSPLELLDSATILQGMSELNRRCIPRIEIFSHIDSTNDYLLQQAPLGAPAGLVCMAEYQSAGKGRRGRRWVSPFGRNLYLSLLWRFESSSSEISGLSLLIGVAVAGVIRSFGIQEACLKWPNDVLYQGRKLAGILLEMSGELGGRCYVVVGVGINLSIPEVDGQSIEQPWIDITQILANATPSRNQLAAKIIESIVDKLNLFERQGLKGLAQAWHAYDCFYHKTVSLRQPSGDIVGTACGIDEQGRLRLQKDGVEHVYAAGEISMRIHS